MMYHIIDNLQILKMNQFFLDDEGMKHKIQKMVQLTTYKLYLPLKLMGDDERRIRRGDR